VTTHASCVLHAHARVRSSLLRLVLLDQKPASVPNHLRTVRRAESRCSRNHRRLGRIVLLAWPCRESSLLSLDPGRELSRLLDHAHENGDQTSMLQTMRAAMFLNLLSKRPLKKEGKAAARLACSPIAPQLTSVNDAWPFLRAHAPSLQ
jgi:hypothetical protein